MMMLEPIVPGSIWSAQQPLKFGPIGIRTRMTVVRLADGSVWVHSPISPTPSLVESINAIGEVRHVVAPNKCHHLFLLPFLDAFPGAKAFAAPGLAEKRADLAFLDVLSPETMRIWEPELTAQHIEGLLILNETVWFHSPTGTLIVTDLLACFGDDNPALSRLIARLLGVYGRLGMSRTIKFFVKDKRAFASTAEKLLSLPIERVIVGHDSIVDEQAKDQLAAAFQWL